MAFAYADQAFIQSKQTLANAVVAERAIALPTQRTRHYPTAAAFRQVFLLAELLAVMEHQHSRCSEKRNRRRLSFEPATATANFTYN